MKKHTCNRCEHTWYPRNPKTPKFCPKCKSPYWNKERVYNLKKLEDNGAIVSL